ncbi:hypothetical protein [Saccharomonospora cyanea]|uniref:Uncharacterized protein n=1 Tax=Saccharomonospora cyanea NA-134 TaxID=882082 RepID=H5XQ63_9PSEU|nr:hypothetical protein [Saccharomonospora cyanea]EHR63329.1 hypothetical protein SaccyDRAFT_4521 [Saccharomonospora cyanea NA-134]
MGLRINERLDPGSSGDVPGGSDAFTVEPAVLKRIPGAAGDHAGSHES